MLETTSRWDARLDQVVTWLLWLTLGLGVFIVFIEEGAVASSYTASAVSGAYVLAVTVIPREYARRRLVREAIIVGGSILTMTAIGITRDVNSPFLLLGLMPVLFAGIRSGFRAGIGTAALSAGILASIVIPLETPPVADLIRWSVLFFLVAITFGYAHRLLTEEGVRSDALAAVTAVNSARLERLESAHRLLTRLAAQAESAELNPIEVGGAALDSVRAIVPFAAASISLASDSGPVAVARVGEGGAGLIQTPIPLRVGEREVGVLMMATERAIPTQQEEAVAAVLQPAALAFSNVLLLQTIAKTAIKEERARLARELHDDIGPSLASLGLALDLAVLKYPSEPTLGVHLEELRQSVGHLVEDVRSTVSDLRAPGHVPPLSEAVFRVLGERQKDHPKVLYEVDERRTTRPSIAAEVNAIVCEAIRNVIHHAEASEVTVQGFVDFDRGSVEIVDDGKGFDADRVTDARFGLVGMRERANRIQARIDIMSDAEGTKITLSWGS
ncbi:MAG: histidine kinase [Acidimicrobiia bacterium]|nr:histidine kinase [Acidimicrobiia bacterium]